MAITATDVSVNIAGDIRWIGTASDGPYTVLELHRYLQDLADDAVASGDDLIDITLSTPSERSTDNIITLLSTYNIDDTMAEHLYDGSITQSDGDELYSGLIVVGSVYGTTTLQIIQNNLLYDTDTPFWGTGINDSASDNILCRMMIKVRTAGADIDGKKIRVYAREWGATFAEFSVTMGLGNATAAIFTNEDLNNTTIVGTVGGWTGITNVEGYQTIDIDNGNGAVPYFSQWNRDIYSINQLYERAKYLTVRGTSETIHGIDGELFRGITHQWAYDTESGGPFVEDEILSWGTGATAGTGLLLALLDSGVTGTMWIQLLTGVAPTDGAAVTGGTSSATCALNGAPTTRTLAAVFIGVSTGTSIIGAFGIGLEAADLTVTDKVFDLTNTLQQPPNSVSFALSGVVSGEDRILVGPADGSDFDFDQLSLNGTLTGAAVTSIVVVEVIPSDTPTSGTIRVQTDSGIYKRIAYSSWTSKTFTVTSTDFSSDNATTANNAFITYLDLLATDASESFTVIYASDRNLFVRVRDGGGSPIKTFETPATLTSAGGSATAIRTTDA